MTSQALLPADQATNAAFDKILHKGSSKSTGGVASMLGKNHAANDAASKAYFQHWDNKEAKDETDAVRQSRTDDYASLTRQ